MTLYYALTGEKPYFYHDLEVGWGPSGFCTLLGATFDAPPSPVSRVVPAREVPSSLDSVLDQALRPDLTERYPNAGAMLTAWQGALSSLSLGGRKPTI